MSTSRDARASYWARRNYTRRRFVAGSAVSATGLAALGLVGCGDDDDDSEGPGAPTATSAPAATPTSGPVGGDLRLGASTTDISTTDVHNSITGADDSHLFALYDGLLHYTAESFEPAPQLASAYEIAPDNLSLTFTLREGITFHDGEPFNAEAMAYNFDRFMDSGNGLPVRIESIAGGSWEAINPTTFKISVPEPYSPMLSRLMLRAGRPASPKAIDALGNDLTRSPVGTGPFRFGSRTVGSELVLSRYEDYWQEGVPRLNSVTRRLFPDIATLYAAMRNREVDLTGRIPFESVEDEMNADNFNIQLQPGTGNIHLSFDTIRQTFRDARLREAVSLAIDRDAINDVVVFGLGTVMDQPIPTGSWAYDPGQPKYEHNPERARTLVSEATGGAGFEFTALGYNALATVLEAMQIQLRDIGVTMNIETGDEGTIIGKVVEGLQQSADQPGYGVVCTTFDLSADPDQYFTNESFGLSETFLAGLGLPPRHDFSELDDLIISATRIFDVDQRKDIYKQILTTVNENFINVGILTFPGMIVAQKNVTARPWVDAKFHFEELAIG